MKAITIEQLAERMGEQIWVKGDLKRIYLDDAGWNTDKMSTKAFIWVDENGDFQVSVKIECPSQHLNWIKSQQNEVKNSICETIERTVYKLENNLSDEEYAELIKKEEKEREEKERAQEKIELGQRQEKFINELPELKERWRSEYEYAKGKKKVIDDFYESLTDEKKSVYDESQTYGRKKMRRTLVSAGIYSPRDLNCHEAEAAEYETVEDYLIFRENHYRKLL